MLLWNSECDTRAFEIWHLRFRSQPFGIPKTRCGIWDVTLVEFNFWYNVSKYDPRRNGSLTCHSVIRCRYISMLWNISIHLGTNWQYIITNHHAIMYIGVTHAMTSHQMLWTERWEPTKSKTGRGPNGRGEEVPTGLRYGERLQPWCWPQEQWTKLMPSEISISKMKFKILNYTYRFVVPCLSDIMTFKTHGSKPTKLYAITMNDLRKFL